MPIKIKRFWGSMVAVLALCGLMASCSEDDNTYDPYANWEARNAEYFLQIVDSARQAIAEAKSLYGDQWEDHCEWRMYKSLTKSPSWQAGVTDSICVHIFGRGTGKGCPQWTDTVRVHYRGFIMPTQYLVNNEMRTRQTVFSQSYVGDFDLNRAVPALMTPASAVAGFSTALQYMHVGDNWLVYIPSALGYGSQAQGSIPAYSTLTFHVNLADYYTAGETIPDWKTVRSNN